jgi:hypothetical protein
MNAAAAVAPARPVRRKTVCDAPRLSKTQQTQTAFALSRTSMLMIRAAIHAASGEL